MELTPEQLKEQLATLKKSFDEASELMRKSLKADIEAVEKKLAEAKEKENAELQKSLDDTKKELGEEKEKLAKVIKAQDEMLAAGNERKVNGQLKSFGELVNEGLQENMGQFTEFAKGKRKDFSFQLKAPADMGFAGNFGTASQSVSMVRPGITESAKRKVHIRDLVPQGSMDGSTFYYVKENGTGEGNPATVAENNWKEQMDLDLIEASANAEYIAGWLRISKKMLADVKGMTSFLQSRLMEKLLRAEDNQLLNGDGTSPNISGITDSGNFTAATGTATIDFEQLVQAVSQFEDELEETADGIFGKTSQPLQHGAL